MDGPQRQAQCRGVCRRIGPIGLIGFICGGLIDPIVPISSIGYWGPGCPSRIRHSPKLLVQLSQHGEQQLRAFNQTFRDQEFVLAVDGPTSGPQVIEIR
jgi:hypothetical protein